MDPISQGALGAALPQAVQDKQEFKAKAITITWVGALAGMSPDLDVFIRSGTDPLLFLEFHRQFTHSLFFIPIGALICALVFARFSRPNLDFKQTYLVCLLGYSTHAMLDACTTYGTQLLWPFSNERFAWNNIAVVDPLATVPLLVGVIAALKTGRNWFAQLGLLWFLGYLGLGYAQMSRAETVATSLAKERGHQPSEVTIKAGFANILLWKSIYIVDDVYYIDAVRVGATPMVYPGTRINKLDTNRDLPWLDSTSQQGIDLERFRWFSRDYLAMDPVRQNFVIDMRYSILPNEVNSLWGIGLDPNADKAAHVTFESDRDASPSRMAIFWDMIKGETCIQQDASRDSSQQTCAITL